MECYSQIKMIKRRKFSFLLLATATMVASTIMVATAAYGVLAFVLRVPITVVASTLVVFTKALTSTSVATASRLGAFVLVENLKSVIYVISKRI